MNKKFLSAILFGALMVTSTGTFVSCKDYDDDIDNLQTQIDKLATKEDMTSQIASLQSALSSAASEAAAAKTAAADALAKATASEKAAAQAALDAAAAKEEAIKAAQDEVAKAKAELEEAIAADFEAVKEDLAKQIAELTEKVEEMTGYTTEMITSLQIIDEENGQEISKAHLNLNYARIEGITSTVGGKAVNVPLPNSNDKFLRSYTFGKGLAGEFAVAEGDINTVTDDFMVNLAPINAAVSADKLSLINGKGADLNAYVNMDIRTTSKNFYTRAAATGVRTVSVQLKKDVDFEAFDKLVIAGVNHASTGDCADNHAYINYALAVSDQYRTVTSDYGVTMHVVEEQPALDIATESELSSDADRLGATPKDIASYADGGDGNGNDEGCYPVALDTPFSLKVGSNGGSVWASYVVVDYNNSNLTTTDKAALKSMSFTGVDAVSLDKEFAITVSGTYAAGVCVPMKLVTIDYLGNVEQNVFWVKANEPALATINFVATPKSNVTKGEAWPVSGNEMQAFTVPANTASYTLEWVVGEVDHRNAYTHYLRDTRENINYPLISVCTVKDGNIIGNDNILELYRSNKSDKAYSWDKVAYAKFVGTLNLQLMKEDKVYEGIIKFYDAKENYLGSNVLTIKKVLPTAVPANFSAKTNAINAGVLTVYPEPETYYDNDQKPYVLGQYMLDKAFNNWTSSYDYKVVNADGVKVARYDATAKSLEEISVVGSTDTYKTTISYNYGKILYVPEGHGVLDTPQNHVVVWDALSTKFGCLPVDSKYEWTETPVVYYRENNTIMGKITYDKDGKEIDFANVIKVTDPYGKEVNPFGNDEYWMTWAPQWNPSVGSSSNTPKITLITNGNVENEFFTAEWGNETKAGKKKTTIVLTKTSTEVVLSGNVETTVQITYEDGFGHEHKHNILTFTMLKEHTAAE